MDTKNMELFQTLCFLFCMQHGEGLITKAPSYIKEKQKIIRSPLAAWQMLDLDCQVNLLEWSDKWGFPAKDLLIEIHKDDECLTQNHQEH